MVNSGIFGYINYLVERDRQFIIDTLLNGESLAPDREKEAAQPLTATHLRPLTTGVPWL